MKADVVRKPPSVELGGGNAWKAARLSQITSCQTVPCREPIQLEPTRGRFAAKAYASGGRMTGMGLSDAVSCKECLLLRLRGTDILFTCEYLRCSP